MPRRPTPTYTSSDSSLSPAPPSPAPAPEPSPTPSQKHYEITAVRDYKKTEDGEDMWLVKWWTYGESYDKWEPLSSFNPPYTDIHIFYNNNPFVHKPTSLPPWPPSEGPIEDEIDEHAVFLTPPSLHSPPPPPPIPSPTLPPSIPSPPPPLPSTSTPSTAAVEINKGKRKLIDETLPSTTAPDSLQAWSDTATHPGQSSGSKGRNRDAIRRQKKRKLKDAQRVEEDKALVSLLPQIIGLDNNVKSSDIHIIERTRNPVRLQIAQEIQAQNLSHPHGFMKLQEIKKEVPDIIELTSGYNVLVDKDTKEIFGTVYFRCLSDLAPPDQAEVQEVMRLVDLVTRTTHNVIKVNGASHAGKDSAGSHGNMRAYGWRQSFAKNGVIGRYVNKNTQAASDQMKVLDEGMFQVGLYFEQRFKTLNRCAYEATQAHAKNNNIPRFDYTGHQDWNQNCGPNMISTTRSGFCNTPHKDNDTSPYNIGFFFAGEVEDQRFNGKLSRVSKYLHGGEFWWAEYGVVVAHAAAGCWAEVIWRGDKDFHGTLSCWLEEGTSFDQVDRWGSSGQITRAFENRVRGMMGRAD